LISIFPRFYLNIFVSFRPLGFGQLARQFQIT